MATTPDYPIIGPPRITAAGFADVLRGAGSPASTEAAACYQAFVAAGVDPAVGLAIFRKESTYGKFGRARANRSWGNIRGGVGYPLDSSNFRIYPTWTMGAQDAARLLVIYGRNQIRPGKTTSTVQTFPFVWAPSSDGNAPDGYGDSLARWIGEWQRKYLPGGPGSYTPPAGQLVSDETHPMTEADFAIWQAKLAEIGVPNAPDHVITAAEAATIHAKIYKISGSIAANGIREMTGKTVRGWWALGSVNTTPVPGLTELGEVARAVASLPAAVGEVLVNIGYLGAILALIVVGLYLVARSQGVAPRIPG